MYIEIVLEPGPVNLTRHSQPEFHVKMMRDAITGYAELPMKGWNVTGLKTLYTIF